MWRYKSAVGGGMRERGMRREERFRGRGEREMRWEERGEGESVWEYWQQIEQRHSHWLYIAGRSCKDLWSPYHHQIPSLTMKVQLKTVLKSVFSSLTLQPGRLVCSSSTVQDTHTFTVLSVYLINTTIAFHVMWQYSVWYWVTPSVFLFEYISGGFRKLSSHIFSLAILIHFMHFKTSLGNRGIGGISQYGIKHLWRMTWREECLHAKISTSVCPYKMVSNAFSNSVTYLKNVWGHLL